MNPFHCILTFLAFTTTATIGNVVVHRGMWDAYSAIYESKILQSMLSDLPDFGDPECIPLVDAIDLATTELNRLSIRDEFRWQVKEVALIPIQMGKRVQWVFEVRFTLAFRAVKLSSGQPFEIGVFVLGNGFVVPLEKVDERSLPNQK